MNSFQFTANIPAPSQDEAVRKMEALMTMASYLSARELKALENVLTSDPAKVAVAKSFLGFE